MRSDVPPDEIDPVRRLFEAHPRGFLQNRYVYPVLSRRAGGISIGVNLNRDKLCNFNCVYCQIDRTKSCDRECVEIEPLSNELQATVELVVSGQIYQHETFRHTPSDLRRLNDIAISGDGEPTLNRLFVEAVQQCVDVRRRYALETAKVVLITNASMFHRPNVQQGLEILDSSGGEIWAKLDCGTEAFFRRIARSTVPFQQILDNLLDAARLRPLVIQSLWFRLNDERPSSTEQQAYCDQLKTLVTSGGQIKQVQIYTLARLPTESSVAALNEIELETIAERVRSHTALPVATFCTNPK